MTRKLFLFLFAIIIFGGCKNNSVRISGTLTNPEKGGYIFLDELKANNLTTVDSVIISNDGTFKFELNIKNPAFYLIKISDNNFLTMLVAPGEKMTLNAKYDSLNYPIAVSGSKGTELLVEYNLYLKKTIDKLSGLNTIYMQNTENPQLPKIIESLDSLAKLYLDDINLYTKNHIDNNISSLVTLVALYQQVAPNVYVLNPSEDMKYFIKVDSSLFNLFPDYEPVAMLHSQVKEFLDGMPSNAKIAPVSGGGTEAPEITLPSPNGDTIRLSSTRGSVVLLDFWAAWCTPCRMENPNLVKAYDLYHKDGFEIFQVSLDKTKEAWMKGIKDDKLERWIHVSDIQYWNSIVVPLYKIESIPSNLLLDKDGKIIASNLRGEKLHEKLAEIFKH
jgi:thiol-disulfide isomerase/thioredoxin